MKCKIEEEKEFKPFKLIITIENQHELYDLWSIFGTKTSSFTFEEIHDKLKTKIDD